MAKETTVFVKRPKLEAYAVNWRTNMVPVHNNLSPLVLPTVFDVNATKTFTIVLRPDVWVADTIYYANSSLVVPSVFNGFFYLATNGGTSDATEPTWPCTKDETVNDGCVIWQAQPYEFYLGPDVDIQSVTWSADNPEIIVTDEPVQPNKASARVSNVPDGIARFALTAHFVLNNGEEDDRTIVVPVGEL